MIIQSGIVDYGLNFDFVSIKKRGSFLTIQTYALTLNNGLYATNVFNTATSTLLLKLQHIHHIYGYQIIVRYRKMTCCTNLMTSCCNHIVYWIDLHGEIKGRSHRVEKPRISFLQSSVVMLSKKKGSGDLIVRNARFKVMSRTKFQMDTICDVLIGKNQYLEAAI